MIEKAGRKLKIAIFKAKHQHKLTLKMTQKASSLEKALENSMQANMNAKKERNWAIAIAIKETKAKDDAEANEVLSRVLESSNRKKQKEKNHAVLKVRT